MGQRVRLTGWVEDLRPLGALVFATIRDSRGIAQAVFAEKVVGEAGVRAAARITRQSVVVVEGVVQESKAKEFAVELLADRFQVLNEAKHPLPIDPTGRVPAKIDVRLDARPLDLRNPQVAAIYRIRSVALQAIREAFITQGFIEVNTSRIIGAASEGGANLFTVDYFGRRAYLAQSPQLYKEELTMSLERVFEIGNFFRAEKSATRRHLSEFISIDMEAAFMDEYDVMGVAEAVVVAAIRAVRERCGRELEVLGHRLEVPERPFPQITYREAVEVLQQEGVEVEYGEDLTDGMLRALGRRRKGFYWITEWPLKLKPFYIAAREDDPELSRGFDLQWGHLELASGGMRIHRREELERRLREADLDPEDFRFHLQAYDWGMPPHSGWGMGMDRLTMVLTGRQNIREVVLYPRDRFRLHP